MKSDAIRLTPLNDAFYTNNALSCYHPNEGVWSFIDYESEVQFLLDTDRQCIPTPTSLENVFYKTPKFYFTIYFFVQTIRL